MQASIHLKDGRWKEAKMLMKKYNGKDKLAQEVVCYLALLELTVN
jgi:hypothetical protein